MAPSIGTCESYSVVPTYGTDYSAWDLTDTRPLGSTVWVDGGIHVQTFPDPDSGLATSQSKAAAYLDFDLPLSQAAELDIVLEHVSGVRPSLQVGVDLDHDGDFDGYLVYESIYGDGLWASNGIANDATLAAAAPHENIGGYPVSGFSLGSGIIGESLITELKVGCTSFVFDDEAPLLVQSCNGTFGVIPSYENDPELAWDFSQTRTAGANTFTPNGLFVETFPWSGDGPAQNKAAGYLPLDIPLYLAGEYDIVLSNTTGAKPSLQIGVDLDNDGTEDGYLVYESIYGSGLWASSHISENATLAAAAPHENVGGYPVSGQLQSWVDAFPTAQIKHVGYSLGSGVVGSALIEKLVLGCNEYTFDDRPPVLIQECTSTSAAPVSTNTAVGGWDFSQTRLRGENVWVPDGLRVTTYTDDTGMVQNQSKAAGYKNVDLLLAEAGTLDIDWTTLSGTTPPSLQLGVDLDADGDFDGYLVYEPLYYGDRLWASSGIQSGGFTGLPVSPGGDGGPIAGTLNQYLEAYPDAEITQIGYSLGSGVVGSHIITKLTVGCIDYTFDEVPYFIDVPEGAPFYDDVQWMARKGISIGYPEAGGAASFHPIEDVSRQAMAQFLYRAAGSPSFTPPVTPSFSDVPPEHAFYLAIEWMKAEGLTVGNADGTFTPEAPISRQATAAFLYRAAGQPAFTAPETPSFTDLVVDQPFYLEIEWMKAEGITVGNADGTFGAIENVSRQAIAAFLHRASGD
jgi:hypothetical protein